MADADDNETKDNTLFNMSSSVLFTVINLASSSTVWTTLGQIVREGASHWAETRQAYSLMSSQARWRHLLEPSGPNPAPHTTCFQKMPVCRVPAAELQRIQAMEMRCYRKILRISYKDHVTNEEVRAKIQRAIGPHEDLLTIVKRRKLQWYGHVSRSSGLAKTILKGTVKWGRRQGRQKKRREDNIREWTGMEFAKSHRAVENREKKERKKKKEENWLPNHLWCPNDPRG